MNEHLLRTLAQHALTDPIYPSPLFPPSPYYRFLKRLAEHLQPSLSIELGVCGGGGSLHLALGNPAGRVVGVDFAYDHPEQIEHIYKTCANFTFWQGDSVEDAGKIVSDFGMPQIVFVDTVHTYEATMLEFGTWRQYLDNNWVVCFDDLFRPGMDKAWAELPEPKVRLDALHTGAEQGGGFGVVWSG